MKAKEIITEIARLSAGDYEGGKNYLGNIPMNVKWQPLPGVSGLQWGIDKRGTDEMNICIIDPTPSPPVDNGPFQKPYRYNWLNRASYARLVADRKAEWEEERKGGKVEMIGRLTLSKYHGPIKNAWEVHTITVDEERRGIGLAKALYGLVLYTIKATLVSGDSQTPGGRRNWMSLASIPGVEVKGLLSLSDEEFGPKKALGKQASDWEQVDFKDNQNNAQKKIEMLMQLGFQYVGKTANRWNGIEHYFGFDVTGGNGELAPVIKNKLSQIYDKYGTLLYARWTGQQ
jgi:hypothetical protein